MKYKVRVGLYCKKFSDVSAVLHKTDLPAGKYSKLLPLILMTTNIIVVHK